jgi:CubicO group peptidase (beta-lactamase class C family)
MRYFYSLLLLLLSGAVKAQPAKKSVMDFDSLFQSYFKPDEPGGAVLIVKDNKIIYQKGFGIADITTKEMITPQTLFNVGSISKTFVAYGILKLASEGKLSLEDNLYKYFPDFKKAAIAQKIKLYHLLTHTSGIPDSRPVKQEHDFYLTAKDEENFAPLKRTKQLEFEPGTKYKYSNPAFNGLALIIEKVTGIKWQSYINDIIFKSAGMKTSTITDGPHPVSGVSHAYILSKGLHSENDKKVFEELDYGEEPTFAAAGNGGVWSSVEELWKYEQAIQQNIFLDSNWINKSRTAYPFPDWKDSIPSRLGLSWFLTKEMNLNMIGHTGSQGGFISDYCWLPEKKIFYVLLCNIPKPIKEIRGKLFSILQQNNWLDD